MSTSKIGFRIALISMSLALLTAGAHAQQPPLKSDAPAAMAQGPVHATLSAHKVKIKDGKEERFEDAGEARPGDVIEYRTVYRNTGTQVVRDVQAILPLPAGAVYQPGSARPAEVMARVNDTADFAAVPLKRKITEAKQSKETDVPPAEYRALRWNLGELAPGQSKTVSARIVVPGGAAQ